MLFVGTRIKLIQLGVTEKNCNEFVSFFILLQSTEETKATKRGWFEGQGEENRISRKQQLEPRNKCAWIFNSDDLSVTCDTTDYHSVTEKTLESQIATI